MLSALIPQGSCLPMNGNEAAHVPQFNSLSGLPKVDIFLQSRRWIAIRLPYRRNGQSGYALTGVCTSRRTSRGFRVLVLPLSQSSRPREGISERGTPWFAATTSEASRAPPPTGARERLAGYTIRQKSRDRWYACCRRPFLQPTHRRQNAKPCREFAQSVSFGSQPHADMPVSARRVVNNAVISSQRTLTASSFRPIFAVSFI
jgi:hypothetical protein